MEKVTNVTKHRVGAPAQVVAIETKGAKVFGIIALFFAVIAFFVPFLGIWLGIFSCLLAVYPAFSRFGRVWALSTAILNAINAVIFTPTFWISLGLANLAAEDAKQGRMGAAAASTGFSVVPWLWIICFVGLFALTVFNYMTARK
jgi:hypothetical protein